MTKIAIIGGGAWGTALAQSAVLAGNSAVIWTPEEDVVEAINREHQNSKYLKGVKLDASIKAMASLKESLREAYAAMLVVPAQAVREVSGKLKDILPTSTPLIICSKGIEVGSGLLMHEVVASILPKQQIAVLSGPNFAAEVAKGLPAVAVLACKNKEAGQRIINSLHHDNFSLFLSDDLIGAEIGGAVKNVLAIGCGIMDGAGFGENARAALLTMGLKEIAELAIKVGGKAETIYGLAGLGDVILTCTSKQSRNFSLGYEVGKGRDAASVLAEKASVTEGVATAEVVSAFAKKYGVHMPICGAIGSILQGRVNVDALADVIEQPSGLDKRTEN